MSIPIALFLIFLAFCTGVFLDEIVRAAGRLIAGLMGGGR